MSDVNLTIYDCDDDGIGNLTDNAVTINTANDYYFLMTFDQAVDVVVVRG